VNGRIRWQVLICCSGKKEMVKLHMSIHVLIIHPNPGQKNKRPQLGLLHLAAMLLEQGYRVKLLDRSLVTDDQAVIDVLVSD